MKKLLPQANSLSTVIDVFIYIATTNNWTMNDVADFCKFNPRQSAYYVNACHYLGLIDNESKLTDLGQDIISSPEKIKERVFECVISDHLISKIFAYLLIEGDSKIKEYTIRVLEKEYPEYGEAVILRRTSTIVNWCLEIKLFIKKR